MEDEEQRNVLSDNNLRLMRIREQPIHSDESLLVVDQLERGFLRLYEYTGGSIYISEEDAEMIGGTNAVMVAELTVSLRPGKKEVKIDRRPDEEPAAALCGFLWVYHCDIGFKQGKTKMCIIGGTM